MFSSNFIDGTQQRLEIPVLEGHVGEALIEFAYSGKIRITSENVVDLLAGANFLQGFEFVEKSCSDYLKLYSSKNNIFQILQVADDYHQDNLKRSLKDYCIRNFVDCVESDHETFLNLHENLFKELMSNNELIVAKDGMVYLGMKQEEYLLEKVIEYLDHNQGRNLKDGEILSCVHLPLFKKQNLRALKSNSVLKNQDSFEVIEKALKLKKTKKSSTEKPRIVWARRRQCGEYQLWKGRCLANGGHVDNLVETFDDKEKICIEEDYVTGMEFWIRRWDGRPVIGGIKVHYSNGTSAMHGSDKGDEKEEFTLELDEKIVKVDSQSGWMIDNLTFYTNKDRKLGPYGGPGGSFRHETPPGCYGYMTFVNGAVVTSQNDLGITKLQFVWRFFRLPDEKHVPDYVEPVNNDYYDDFDYDFDDDYDGYDDFVDYDDFYDEGSDDFEPHPDDWDEGWIDGDEAYGYIADYFSDDWGNPAAADDDQHSDDNQGTVGVDQNPDNNQGTASDWNAVGVDQNPDNNQGAGDCNTVGVDQNPDNNQGTASDWNAVGVDQNSDNNQVTSGWNTFGGDQNSDDDYEDVDGWSCFHPSDNWGDDEVD
ncbi:hypothetical protein QZH41_007025 [Actinostola sp. cb2023]|nr:hypothetical protein QZH41_007025 [Actinostola sp. cb2023]